MVKTIQMTSSPEPPGGLGCILQEAYGKPLYIKQLKSFQSDHKQTSSGRGKVGKNDAKFLIHEPFELES